MIARNIWKSMVGLTAVLALTLAVPALAHGPSRGTFGGHAAPRAPGLLTQLIFPCQAACATTDRECDEAADAAAVTCINDACPTEVQNAQTACATDRRSEDCIDAVSALHTCSASCLTTRQSALSTCRDAQTACRAACD